MSPVNLEDYIPVNERIERFLERWPDGRLVTARTFTRLDPDGKTRVYVKAKAYRTPEDPLPGVGWSWMELPGSTNFTRGSELENTETSSWGRAIAATGIEVRRGIATAEEVRNKSGPPVKAGEETLSPLGHLSRDGLVVRGQGQNSDLQWREQPDGTHKVGFLLEVGDNKPRPQVVIAGPLGKALFEATSMDVDKLEGRPVVVEGDAFEVRQQGRRMFYRIQAARVQTEEWTIPAPAEVGKFDDGEPVALGLGE